MHLEYEQTTNLSIFFLCAFFVFPWFSDFQCFWLGFNWFSMFFVYIYQLLD
jgi:hypothetical protein